MKLAMQSRLAGVCLLAIAVLSEGTSPLEQTLSLITRLEARITKDGEVEEAAYRKYFEFCDDITSEKKHEIKLLKADVEKLQAEHEKAAGDSESAAVAVDELTKKISARSSQVAEATAVRSAEAATFQTSEQELVSAMEMLGRAVEVLERQMKSGAAAPTSLAQMGAAGIGLDNAVVALKAVVDAAGFSVDDTQRLTALVQSSQDDSGNDDDGDEGAALGAPKEAAYETHSTGVADLLGDMRDKAEERLQGLRAAETEARHNYDLLKQSLEDEVAAMEDELVREKGGKAEAEEVGATKEGDGAVAARALAGAEEALGATQQGCMRHAADHEASAQGRAEELGVLTQARTLLEGTTVGAASRTYSFAQVAATSTSSSGRARELPAKGRRLVEAVQRLAAEHHSTQLTQLASRVAAVIRMGGSGGASPFAKVSQMISDMIQRLQKEASKEATEKEYCDNELNKTSQRLEELEGETDKLKNKIDQSASASATLQGQSRELELELAALERQQQEVTAARTEAHAAYLEAKTDLQQGMGGVRSAIRTLREYYNEASGGEAFLQEQEGDGSTSLRAEMAQPKPMSTFAKSKGAGAGIIGTLEVIESDLAKGLAQLETEESGAQSEYDAATQASKETKAAKGKDLEYKNRENQGLARTISDVSSDHATASEELAAVEEYRAKVEERCIAKPEEYEDRAARRVAEVRGLRAAIAALNGEGAGAGATASSSSFLQRRGVL